MNTTTTVSHGAVDALTVLAPYAVAAFGAFLVALLGLLTTALTRLNQKWAADILATNTKNITMGLTNAAAGLIQKYGAEGAMSLDEQHPAVTAAAGEVIVRIGQTLNKVGITPESVAKRILEKIPQVLPIDAAPVTVPVVVQSGKT